MDRRTDATSRERVREPGRALVFLREREAPVAADERGVVGHGVGDALPQVGEVELHVGRNRRRRASQGAES